MGSSTRRFHRVQRDDVLLAPKGIFLRQRGPLARFADQGEARLNVLVFNKSEKNSNKLNLQSGSCRLCSCTPKNGRTIKLEN
jgi:hypothetical protein